MSEAGDSIGSLATGALRAHEAERLSATGNTHHETGTCPNCGTERVGPYCHACGQPGHLHKNLMGLVHDIAHGVFHFEGKVWHTLPLLAWRPGELTRRYVDGERAKFVSPMALFLFSVFLMFAVVSNVGSHQQATAAAHKAKGHENPQAVLKKEEVKLAALETARAKADDKEARAEIDEQIDDLKSEMRTLEIATSANAAMRGADANADAPKMVHLNTGWSWLDQGVGHMSQNPELTLYKLKTYAYKYSWALIPISVPFIWLLFAFRRDVGLYDHAIFSIYSLSFMSLGVVALTLFGRLGIPSALISLLAIFVPPVHMYRQLKGTYALGRFGALWRTFALLIVTSITSSLFIAFLFYMGNE